ncbi:ArnT family glycosyltransferase [Acuticoccus sp.]|uniref:ArnT family glycosyltransferase n=1 Tax=Acuticoccus sp. TaxID=1904378 RepID=UPI003B51AFA1
MRSAPPHASRDAPQERTVGTLVAGLLVLLAALAFLPGLASVPPIDRDEPRYTQATKQMVETGDYVRIRFQDGPRHKKPIGIHWLQAVAVWMSGEGAAAPLWVYRLPSLLGAVAAILLTLWAARAFLPMPAATCAAALLGATVILGVEARLAKTDAVLLATVVLMQGALARVWLREASGNVVPLLFWLGLALGILVKGPIAPMVAALTVLVLGWRSGWAFVPRLRPLLGMLIVAAVCLPWFVAIGLATDGAFITTALGRDFLGKAAGGQEGHWAPPLTHLAVFFAVAWPMAPFALAAARLWISERGPALLFAAAWAIPSWIVFEATPTKLPHYTLPLLPAVAIATVAVLWVRDPSPLWRRAAAVLALVTPVGLVGAALLAPLVIAHLMGEPVDAASAHDAPTVALALVPVVLALLATAAIWRGRPLLSRPVLVPAVGSALAAQAVVWGLLLPSLSAVWISPRLVAAAEAVATCREPRVVSVGGYNEPSMIFLAGTDTALVNAAEAVAIAAQECAVIAASERRLEEVRLEAEAAGVPLAELGTITGFNISKGDPVSLTLFARDRP